MILTPDNEYVVVLDACVLIPMCLCDTLLRLAEEPAFYRPIWSAPILKELGDGLVAKIGLTPQQKERRIAEMSRAFPEALVSVPSELIEGLTGLPDPKDRHVLAAALRGRAHTIVTQNVKDFPQRVLDGYEVLCQTADEFLIHQLTLSSDRVLEKLDAQAAAIRKDRLAVVQTLKKMTPKFAQIVEERSQ